MRTALGDVDLTAATIRVERSLEETKAGLREDAEVPARPPYNQHAACRH